MYAKFVFRSGRGSSREMNSDVRVHDMHILGNGSTSTHKNTLRYGTILNAYQLTFRIFTTTVHFIIRYIYIFIIYAYIYKARGK